MPSFLEKFAAGYRAAVLPPVPLPKPPKGQQAEPSYRTIVGGIASMLLRPDRALINTDRLGVRQASTTFDALRQMSFSSPDLSAAMFAALRTGIPERYTMVARNMDGQIDPVSTGIAHELLRRLTYLGNTDGTFGGTQMTIQSMSECLGRELLLYGACAGEVVLDAQRIPASLNAVSVSKIRFFDDKQTFRPIQYIGGEEIDLDIPTFIYTILDQDLLALYSSSPFEAAMQPVLADLEFNNDMRLALKRAVLPRLVATIDSEKVKKSCPPDILNDSDKFASYKQALISAVTNVVNGAKPEDALITFSEVTYAYVDGGKDPSLIIEKMQNVLNSKLQTGIKTLPVVLGHGQTSASSSAEALLFIKASNMIRVKLNEFYSRALTVATRITGQDCYVEFVYASLNLRPESELEAYRQMEQARILELLSLGFLTDEEASVKLTGNLPPAGFKSLSGTMFQVAQPVGNAQPGTDASPTSAMKKPASSGTPTAPTAPKS